MEEPEENRSHRILQTIGSSRGEPITVPTIVAVAHPDDETIGCGCQLGRFPQLSIVHTTDGAPRTTSPPEFGDWKAYRETRARELQLAAALAGVPADRLTCLGWPDQEASLHLPEIAVSLATRFADAGLVITHAYEGGHPDHDATAFAVRSACDLVVRDGGTPPVVLEMPLYRAGQSGWIVQRFESNGAGAIEVHLTAAEQDMKRQMFAAHHSQRGMLAMFETDIERFRCAENQDFRLLPNGGQLIYEEHAWGMTGWRWLELTTAALRDLGLEAHR